LLWTNNKGRTISGVASQSLTKYSTAISVRQLLSIIHLTGRRKRLMKTLKTFLKTFAGSAIGFLAYNLITAPLVGGFHPYPTLIGMLVFGAVFGFLSSLCGTRPVQCFINGFATVIGFGGAILCLLGTATFQANVAADGLSEVILSIVLLSSLLGLGGHVAILIRSSKS
jgi:hypothetical protein